MPQSYTNYEVAPKGFATSYPDASIPLDYCKTMKNLFMNSSGNAEKRRGISTFKNVDTIATITGIHELVQKDGTVILFTSGAGIIHKYDDPDTPTTSTAVYTFPTTTTKIESIYIQKKLIFWNGIDRTVYTEDGTEFFELRSNLEVGRGTAGTSAGALYDSDITNWTGGTNVAAKDLVYYQSLSAYGLILTVTSAYVTHTDVSTSAAGIGSATDVPTSGRPYIVIDTTELNIVPVSSALEYDNDVAIASGSTSSIIKVDQIDDWTDTEIRKGDYVYNSAMAAVTNVLTVSANQITVTDVSGQSEGDHVYFLKSSSPIIKKATTHYGRVYAIDGRDNTQMRVTGPNNPQDWGSTQAGTFDLGTLQPDGEKMKNLLSYQRFFTIAGSKNIYFYEGTDPIGDSGVGTDWDILGQFPLGLEHADGITNVGNDIYWITSNGIRKATLKKTSSQLSDNNTSKQIDKTLRDLITAAPESDVQMFHYPRRSWVVCRIGSLLYIYNYVLEKSDGNSISDLLETNKDEEGSWHLFNGQFAQQKIYYVRENNDMLTGNVKGQVNIFDKKGIYGDLGDPIPTVYETGWLSLSKDQKDIRRKHVKAIKPIFESVSNLPMKVSIVAPYSGTSTDSKSINPTTTGDVIGSAVINTVVIGGQKTTFKKQPLRASGEAVKLMFETNTTTGPHILSNFTLFYAMMGVI